MNDVHVYVVHARVIEKVPVGPAPAEVSSADVAEAVVDAAVEADFRSPVARVPEIRAIGPTPIARGPEQTNRRRFDPRARYPKISAVVAVAPIAWRPDVAVAGANGLRVNREDWRSDRHRKNDLR